MLASRILKRNWLNQKIAQDKSSAQIDYETVINEPETLKVGSELS